MSNAESIKLAGTWYLDSSSDDTWCALNNAYAWLPGPSPRRTSRGGLFENISALLGKRVLLHGFLQRDGRRGEVVASSTATTTQDVEEVDVEKLTGTDDPYHPHANDDECYWVMKTDFTRFVLLLKCKSQVPLYLLMSRQKEGLTEQVRQEAELYLRQQGFVHRFYQKINRC